MSLSFYLTILVLTYYIFVTSIEVGDPLTAEEQEEKEKLLEDVCLGFSSCHYMI